MSSDAALRQRVKGLLQEVVDRRKYQQGSLAYPIRGAGAYIGGDFVSDKYGEKRVNMTKKQLLKLLAKQEKKKAPAKAQKKAKRCPVGTRKKCVGKGNIYDYNYGDGLMEDESDIEYDNAYGGVLLGGDYVGGKRKKAKKLPKKCQIKKKKVKNSWICYVRKYAIAKDIPYAQAIQEAGPSYKKLKKGKGLGNMFYN